MTWPAGHRRLLAMGTPPPSSPAPSGAEAGRGSSQDAMKIMVSVLVVVIFCTLFYCIYCWRWRKRNGTREEVAAPEPAADVELGPAAHGPGLHPRRHQQLLQGQQARRGRLRPCLQGRSDGRRGDRGEAAVGAVAAGRGGVPERGGADRQAAAPQPGASSRVVRRARREAARLRVPPQPQPRRLPLRRKQERAAGLEDAAQHHPGGRPRAAVPPRGLAAEGRPPGPQGQQRAPRQQDEPQDLRLRHGQDLRGRVQRGQHRPRRRNLRVHGAGVRDGRRLLGEVGRVQLRGAPHRDPRREAERGAVPRGARPDPHPRRVEAVDGGEGGGVHGRGAGAVLLQGRGVAVLPRGPPLRAGRPGPPADHVHRPAHAHQRPHEPPAARQAAALHQAQDLPGLHDSILDQDRVHILATVHQRRLHHRRRATMMMRSLLSLLAAAAARCFVVECTY